jgi:hypothetical protein
MALNYTCHARERMEERGISEAECEAAVTNDKNPWQTKLKAGDHFRFFYDRVTVITDEYKAVVVTASKGDARGWDPEKDLL